MVVTNEMPVIFAKFKNDEMLAEMGRLVFSLLNAFVVSGYRVITDANVTKHASKLNARSVLMRGTAPPGRGGWLSRLRPS